MLRKFLTVLLIPFAISACNKTDSVRVATSIDDDFIGAHTAFESSKIPASRVSTDTVSSSEGVWLGSRSVAISGGADLPKKFEAKDGISIFLDEPVPLSILAANISEITGIPVSIDGQVSSDKVSTPILVSSSGRLSDLLNKISADLDLLWKYDKEKVIFFETETKTFDVYALSTDISFSSRVQTDDSNQVSLESTLQEWDEIEKSLTAILEGVPNAKFNVSRSLGTITVSASPSVLSRVGDYIAKQNRRLSQQVSIDVKVLQVSINNSNAFGLDLTAAINSTSGLSLSASTPGSSITAANSTLNFAVADIAGSSLSAAAGTSSLISALAKQGKVSLMTNAAVTTRNNRVAPVSNVRTQGYIKRIESRTFTTVESSSVEQDTIETGFSMQLLPSIIDGGKVLMLFKMSLRELIRLEPMVVGADPETGKGGITIQMPEVEERAFMQEVVMESGQMLVLSGFERQTDNDTRSGLGDPDFMVLGGSRETSSTRDVLVVILTPQVHTSVMDSEKNANSFEGAPLN